MISIGGGSDGGTNTFAFGMLMFSMATMILLPIFIASFGLAPQDDVTDDSYQDIIDEMTQGYYDFTGAQPASETVWALTGIYTPYNGGSYGYTEDGWLYGQKIVSYSPSQYSGTQSAYTVNYSDPVYSYSVSSGTTFDGHANGDIYTSVTFDVGQKSDIFFTTSGKHDMGDSFYYDYSGYRYAFQPLASYDAVNSNGDKVPVTANTTSLSLIWYDYYGSSGIAGQLIISGSDSGVGYLTADQIVRAFDSTTSTAKFLMTFNGIDMNVYIRINPYYTTAGYSVEECYNNGYWSVMVTSLADTASAYTGTDYSFNIWEIFDIIFDLMTFNMDDYEFSGIASAIASLTIVVPLYIGLIAIGLTCYPVLIFASLLAIVQGILTAIQNWKLF